jgi:hypothetical protein
MITRQVWKFDAPKPGIILPAHVPLGAKPLYADLQHGEIVWWAEVDPEAPTLRVDVITVGTGWDIPESAKHVGTVLDGAFVWHVYVRGLGSPAA